MKATPHNKRVWKRRSNGYVPRHIDNIIVQTSAGLSVICIFGQILSHAEEMLLPFGHKSRFIYLYLAVQQEVFTHPLRPLLESAIIIADSPLNPFITHQHQLKLLDKYSLI